MKKYEININRAAKHIFIFSILMLLVTFVFGVINGSRMVGFTMWYWIYLSWKSYKKDIKSLFMFQKFILWFMSIIIIFSYLIIFFNARKIESQLNVSFWMFLVISLVSILMMFCFYKYLEYLNDSKLNNEKLKPITNPDDEYYLQAWNEYGEKRDEATWARVFSEADGDESKAKAKYIVARSFYFKNKNHRTSEEKNNESLGLNINESMSFFDKSMLVIFVFILLIWLIYKFL